MSLYDELIRKNEKLAVIGLGYVGLPIALAFAEKINVVGFDINAGRVEQMKNHIDPSNELDEAAFEGKNMLFTANENDLKDVKFFIVAVPTPVDEHNVPNLNPVLSASKSVGKNLKKGDYVVFESTVYPGCTEDDCVPVLEQESGLKFIKDFKAGFSPERINPGDKEHALENITKVVSGCDEESLDLIAKVYELVVQAGVHKAPSIKVAEAAKIIENTQRDLNIALMNELSKIFDLLDINTADVLEAAGTKWNFLPFKPGLVGGHCIGVDPYYLTYKATALGYTPKVILSGRAINDAMAEYVATKTVQHIMKSGKNIRDSKILVMGTTFKENVSDIRNSKIADLIGVLKDFSVHLDVVDPYADAQEVKAVYGYELLPEPGDNYDAIIVAVNHKPYMKLNEQDLLKWSNSKCILIDIKGIFKDKIKIMDYWSL